MYSSVREIRNRLLSLLVRAFIFVLFLSLLFFFFVVIFFLASQNSPVSPPFIGTLQGYYAGHGSWDGIDTVFDSIDELNSFNAILLDESQRVILDRDADPVSTVGSSYSIQSDDLALKLEANGKGIGWLVITSLSLTTRIKFARAIILPIGALSFLLALFLFVVATLLIRRFINPLADVIYAAREVTNGKLGTRISSEGPQDMRSLSESFNEMAASLERNDRERRDLIARWHDAGAPVQ